VNSTSTAAQVCASEILQGALISLPSLCGLEKSKCDRTGLHKRLLSRSERCIFCSVGDAPASHSRHQCNRNLMSRTTHPSIYLCSEDNNAFRGVGYHCSTVTPQTTIDHHRFDKENPT
jgi:hypothetical protein